MRDANASSSSSPRHRGRARYTTMRLDPRRGNRELLLLVSSCEVGRLERSGPSARREASWCPALSDECFRLCLTTRKSLEGKAWALDESYGAVVAHAKVVELLGAARQEVKRGSP